MVDGFTRAQVPALVGLTRRQVIYLAEQHVVRPSIRGSAGRGSPTIYGRGDLHQLRAIASLASLTRGEIPLAAATAVAAALQGISQRSWDGVRLVLDDELAFICETEEQALEALRRSRSMIVIDLGEIEREVDFEVLRRRSSAAA